MSKSRNGQSVGQGARSLPYKRPFVAAMLLVILHYFSLASALALGFILLREKTDRVAQGLIIAIAMIVITWILGYVSRRSARCPLCKGTPLLDNRATKHRKAVRLRPLNYGSTAQLKLACTHRFRCMYCGTPFDLLKKPQSKF